MLLLSEGNQKEGIAHLKLVPREYPAYLFSQAKLVFVALEGGTRPSRRKRRKPIKTWPARPWPS